MIFDTVSCIFYVIWLSVNSYWRTRSSIVLWTGGRNCWMFMSVGGRSYLSAGSSDTCMPRKDQSRNQWRAWFYENTVNICALWDSGCTSHWWCLPFLTLWTRETRDTFSWWGVDYYNGLPFTVFLQTSRFYSHWYLQRKTFKMKKNQLLQQLNIIRCFKPKPRTFT